jgi:hypothetical protein
MTPTALMPALFVPLMLFALYRRFRRNFGRQSIQRKRMTFRIGMFCIVLVLFLMSAVHQMNLLIGAGIGLVLGGALAVLGLRLTKFELAADGQEFYTPNSYIGIVLTAVLVGRLVYRFVVLQPVMAAPHPVPMNADPFAQLAQSPLTLGIFTLLIGYYLVYYIGILREGQKHGVA